MPEPTNETIEQAAKRLWMDCYPNWYDNGQAIKSAVARDYAKKIADSIIRETLDEYTNDENHERVVFWRGVIAHLDKSY